MTNLFNFKLVQRFVGSKHEVSLLAGKQMLASTLPSFRTDTGEALIVL